MNRRGFLKFAAAAPVVAPMAMASSAATGGYIGAGYGVVGAWGNWSLPNVKFRLYQSTPPSLSEQVNESVRQMSRAADRAGSIATRSEKAISKLTDFVIDQVERVASLAPPGDSGVREQMDADDLFETQQQTDKPLIAANTLSENSVS